MSKTLRVFKTQKGLAKEALALPSWDPVTHSLSVPGPHKAAHMVRGAWSCYTPQCSLRKMRNKLPLGQDSDAMRA